MIRHNLLLIYRNFKRFKSTFFINLIGLSTGLTCVLLIYLWVKDELNVDRFNALEERLYHVKQNSEDSDGIHTGSGTPGLLAKSLAEEIPEVERAVSVVPPTIYNTKTVITSGDNKIKIRTQYASPDFFNVLSYPLIHGQASKALADVRQIAISTTLAKKLFNTTENLLGKEVAWSEGDNKQLFVISGIFEGPPANATNQFDAVLHYDLFLKSHDWLLTWTSSDPYTYVVLKPGVSVDQFNEKIRTFSKQKDKNANTTLFAQRFSDTYLYGRFEEGKQSGGRIEYVRLFSMVAIFILVIASINYMNLSTAKASRRVKEVGIKKAIGASRKTLMAQYLGESLLMTTTSMLIAILLTDLLLSPFNIVTGKHLILSFDPTLIVSVVLITLGTGLLAGSYPALYLSGFSPATILRGKLNVAVGEIWARKGLVVFQFVVSVILIVCVLIVNRQITYVQSKNLGYNRDNIVYFDTEKVSDAFLAELKSIPGVVNGARFYHDLTGGHGSTYALDWEGKSPDEQINFGNLEVGYDLVETMGFEMSSGKSFSPAYGSVDQIIFNEAAIDAMGLKDPIGKTINIWGMKREIVGVVKDFNFESLYSTVNPCFLFLVPMVDNYPSRIMVKIRKGEERATLAKLEEFYHRYNPGLPFDFKFLDEDFNNLYAGELRVSMLSKYFAELAIVISCLGLFGLASFTAERRLKEIGIRKVLGSSNFGIIYLLSSDFTKIVFVSIVIALPASYFIIKQWLDNFSYRIGLEWWYFAGAGGLALFIAWITVGMQALRASRVNPIQCLKED